MTPIKRSSTRVSRSKPGSLFNFNKFVTPTVVQTIWIYNLIMVSVFVLIVVGYLIASAMPASPEINLETNSDDQNVEIVAHNLGDFDAKGLVVCIDIPRGSASEANPSSGKTRLVKLVDGQTQLQWEVKHLPVDGSERLTFQVEGRAAPRLNVTWEAGRSFSQVSGTLLGILGGSLVFCLFYLLNLRLMLETTLILFRMEEHLRDIKESAA
jgi:hypothetical protein